MNKLLQPQKDPPATKTYRGTRYGCGVNDLSVRGVCVAKVNGQDLNLALESSRESEPSIEWGNKGTASGNLARSILIDYFGKNDVPYALCLRFRNDVISQLPFDGWEITDNLLEAWMSNVLMQEEEYDKASA